MNRLPTEKRIQMLHCFCEGMSLRATGRLCDVAIVTVLKFFIEIGEMCEAFQDAAFQNLHCERIQMDEIWSFVHAKERNLPRAKSAPADAGSLWTWTEMDSDSRLIFAWHTGGRSFNGAEIFMQKVAARVANRPQITSDGLLFYVPAIERNFGSNVDFAQLIKIFGGATENHARYSPPPCIGAKKKVVIGEPDEKHVSTSYMERSNLMLRMHNRRFTRLTNGFSRKLENHAHAVAISMMHHNFCRIHQTLRVTPAMEAGITDHVWEMSEVVALLDSQTQSKAA